MKFSLNSKILAATTSFVLMAGAASAATVVGVPSGGTLGDPGNPERDNILDAGSAVGLTIDPADITEYFIPRPEDDDDPVPFLDLSFTFTGVPEGDAFLQIVFEDLDLPPIEDPDRGETDAFTETVTISSPDLTLPTNGGSGFFVDMLSDFDGVSDLTSFVVGSEPDEAIAIQIALGDLAADDYEVLLRFTAPLPGTGNTPEYLYAAISSTPFNVIPLPAAGWMLLAGLGGLGVMGRRKRANA